MIRIVLICVVGALGFFFALPLDLAGQILRRRTIPPPAFPMPTLPYAELPADQPHAPQPSSPILEGENTFSQPPSTALEPVPGTGSRLPFGQPAPNVTHKLDPETQGLFKRILEKFSDEKPPARIIMPLEAGTSGRLERISMLLEVSLWLGTVIFGSSAGGRVLQLVAPLVRGLLSSLDAASLARAKTAAASISTPISPSAGGTPAGP